MMKNKKKLVFTSALIILVIVLLGYACYKLIPLLISLKEHENQVKFTNYIQGLGLKGILTILVIQVLQIFIAFIPGEIVELLSGILYGPLGGLVICLLGVIIASLLIYYTMKMCASKYIDKYREKLKTYKFLNNPKKIKIYLFILFFIPGLPKDILIYLAPFLPIKFTSFLIISSIARIPSILSSTIIGSSIIEGNYLTSIIIFVIFAILGSIGLIFSDKIINTFSKRDKGIEN